MSVTAHLALGEGIGRPAILGHRPGGQGAGPPWCRVFREWQSGQEASDDELQSALHSPSPP